MKKFALLLFLIALLVVPAVLLTKEKSEPSFELMLAKTNLQKYEETMENVRGLAEEMHMSLMSDTPIKHKAITDNYAVVLDPFLNHMKIYLEEEADTINAYLGSPKEGAGEEGAETTVEELPLTTYKDLITNPNFYYFRDIRTGKVTVALYYDVGTRMIRLESSWIGGIHIETVVHSS